MSYRDTAAWLAREERQLHEKAAEARTARARADAVALADALRDRRHPTVRPVTIIGRDGKMADGTNTRDLIGTDPKTWPSKVDIR